MASTALGAKSRPIGRAAFPVWGGTAELLVTEPSAAARGERMLADDLAAVDAACSRFRPDSEVATVAAARGRPVAISPLFLEFLAAALDTAEATSGAVDLTCGSALTALGYDRDFVELRDAGSPFTGAPRPVAGWRAVEVDAANHVVRVPDGTVLDFGATAKALAADRAAARIAEALGCGVLVNLSGDIAITGPAPAGGWPVRAADGERTGADAPGQTIALSGGGVATSGTTVRYWRRGDRSVHHIVVPETGDAAPVHWRTVTAAAASCLTANTLTTAALVRGSAALPWLTATGCPMRFVERDGTVSTLNGWPEDEPETAWNRRPR